MVGLTTDGEVLITTPYGEVHLSQTDAYDLWLSLGALQNDPAWTAPKPRFA